MFFLYFTNILTLFLIICFVKRGPKAHKIFAKSRTLPITIYVLRFLSIDGSTKQRHVRLILATVHFSKWKSFIGLLVLILLALWTKLLLIGRSGSANCF